MTFLIFSSQILAFGELLVKKTQFSVFWRANAVFESCLLSQDGKANVSALSVVTPLNCATCCDTFGKNSFSAKLRQII